MILLISSSSVPHFAIDLGCSGFNIPGREYFGWLDVCCCANIFFVNSCACVYFTGIIGINFKIKIFNLQIVCILIFITILRFGSYCCLHFTRSIFLPYFVSSNSFSFFCSRSVWQYFFKFLLLLILSFLSLLSALLYLPICNIGCDCIVAFPWCCCFICFSIFCPVLLWSMFSILIFGTMLCSFVEHPRHKMKKKKIYEKIAMCDMWYMNGIQSVEANTHGDRHRSFKILILIRYKSANKSFFIWFVVEKRAENEKRSDRGLLTFLPFVCVCVYLSNDNLFCILLSLHQCPPFKLFYLK